MPDLMGGDWRVMLASFFFYSACSVYSLRKGETLSEFSWFFMILEAIFPSRRVKYFFEKESHFLSLIFVFYFILRLQVF